MDSKEQKQNKITEKKIFNKSHIKKIASICKEEIKLFKYLLE